MSLTNRQIALVQDSFNSIADRADVVAALFYQRLFELKPSLRALFKNDIVKQGQMLMQMLAVAVHSLNNTEGLLPALRQLGQRHAGYGVQKKDYDTVAEALLWTLGQGLGAEFTPELREAWTAAYVLMATAATENAYPEPAL